MSTYQVPTMAEMAANSQTPEVLFWVGCAGSFDERYKAVTQAFVKILNKVGVSFAVLGPEEACTGDPARRAGNEFLFQMQAVANIQVMNAYEVKKVVTACPHCFNTIKNEYPALGGNYEVIHHSEFLQQLINEGKVTLQGGGEFKGKKITFHDPCYLGRANDVYEAPRSVLQKLDAELVEMKRCRAKGLCCGAGGAQMFKEAEKGDKEINIERTEEALATSPTTIATGCPFCNTMMTDGVKNANKEGSVHVMDIAELIANAINSAGLTNVVASVDANNKVIISHTKGGDVDITDTSGALEDIGITAAKISNWTVLSAFTASATAPTSTTADGTLWYSSVVDEVDMMYHNGTTWVGYNDATAFPNAKVTTAATEPTTSLVANDIWISTADLENYPTIYRYSADLTKWVLIDKSDQTTEDGVLFADARYSTDGSATESTIAEMLLSNFLDTDAPDPALYPQGMLLWNLRRSGFNVKKYVRNYVDITADNIRMGDVSMAAYSPDRWVTESGNQEDGSGSFGRHAQRKVIVQGLQSEMNSNQDIRDDESRIFNVMATPGYSELIGEMISLNLDRGLSAFIVGDTPARLTSDATSLNEWGQNTKLAVEDNDDGLVSRDEYLGMFYPWGFTSDNAGNNVVVPPSHMMLRTIALSDQVSYPWFAPAGTRRGGVTNATATGYVNGSGEFVSIALNEGQRDTLYSVNVNPITFINGAGLVNYGQKTRARNASSLDRINVARLVIYLRSQLNKLAKPYIFEPNDKITRDQIKQAAESLCLELVGARALYDFLVVCDNSNNTPARIDRNELYLDIAIEPVKAVEFVYIPLRLKNTGEIAGL